MAKELKRISTGITPDEYELLAWLHSQDSDSGMVKSFISEMTNLIKVELDDMKIFSPPEIGELLEALRDRPVSFQVVQPRQSFLHVLKDFYKFGRKTPPNKDLIDKVDSLSNLQIIILARFLSTLARGESMQTSLDQGVHFFGKEEGFQIMTSVLTGVQDPAKFTDSIMKSIQEGKIKNPSEIKVFLQEYNKDKTGGKS